MTTYWNVVFEFNLNQLIIAANHSFLTNCYLTIRLRARVFYEEIANEAQPSWLALEENKGE